VASGEDEYVNNRFLTSDGDGLLPASVAGLDGEGIPAAVVAPSVLVEELEIETVRWCRRMLEHSPLALRMLKAGMNAADDGLAGIQQLAGDATLLFYQTDEAQHGRDSYVNRTPPDFSRFPRRP